MSSLSYTSSGSNPAGDCAGCGNDVLSRFHSSIRGKVPILQLDYLNLNKKNFGLGSISGITDLPSISNGGNMNMCRVKIEGVSVPDFSFTNYSAACGDAPQAMQFDTISCSSKSFGFYQMQLALTQAKTSCSIIDAKMLLMNTLEEIMNRSVPAMMMRMLNKSIYASVETCIKGETVPVSFVDYSANSLFPKSITDRSKKLFNERIRKWNL